MGGIKQAELSQNWPLYCGAVVYHKSQNIAHTILAILVNFGLPSFI